MNIVLVLVSAAMVLLGLVGNVNAFRASLARAGAVVPPAAEGGAFFCFLDTRCITNLTQALNRDFPATPTLVLAMGVLGLMMAFRTRRKGVYSARFARRDELKDVTLRDYLHHRKLPYALLVGHYVALPEAGEARRRVLAGTFNHDRPLLALTPGYGGRSELGHMACFGMTRSGKSLHLEAQLCTWGGAAVVLDIKGELYRKTAGLRARKGPTFVLSPTGRGHQFDALSAVIASDNGYATAAQIIAAPHLDKEPAFAQRAAAGIEAALRAAVLNAEAPFPFLRRLIEHGGVNYFVNTVLAQRDRDTRLALNIFLGMASGDDYNLDHIMNDRYLLSSWGSMVQRLRPFLQDGVQHLFGGSDVAPRDLMTTAATVYLAFPEASLAATGPVYNLVVTGLVRGMCAYVDDERKGQRPSVRVMVGLDELAVAPLQDLSDMLSTAASRHISMLLYLQSPAQFDALYSKATTETILSNCATQIYFYSQSLANAKYISERCHKVSVDTRAQSKRRGLFMRPTTTVSTTPREVITVDELLTLGGAGRQLAVAFISGKPPVLVQRVNHYQVPEMRARLALAAPHLKRPEVVPAVLQPPSEGERQVDVHPPLQAAPPPVMTPSKPRPIKQEVS